MKQTVMLESADVKKIISKCLKVKPEDVIQTKYSFSIVGLSAGEIQKRIDGGIENE